ncbi:sensor histidine kinase [Adhaeribacter rhizoryzae]|uniref:histidine kinase n=1 Tax=Adhaeribacter rhizoryzae TaxID=2607907 RepID=A0A5M6DPR4_9BACT|nr:HAMP domain-containing sensor histidine kinase [Adhaeribacter rhizoryzae]KAA5549464.1 HAMP domain-containing histidine kinase [Adhaeribacter rhizoryzae]
MSFKNFRVQVVLRVLALGCTLWLFLYLDFQARFTGTLIFLSVLLLLQIIFLIRYLEKSNQQLNKFLDSIHYDDFTETYSPRGEGEVFDKLHLKFNQVLQKFREIRAEKEADAHYYRTLVHHVGTGIISYHKKNGQIHLLNTAAKRLLGVNQLHNLHDLNLSDAKATETLLHLPHGEKTLLKLEQGGQMVQLSVNAIEIRLRGEEYRLLSVQNIQQELEEKEMEAWQNLIKILTHEIMNSVTPISSLAASVSEELTDHRQHPDQNHQIRKEDLGDIELAMQTIQRRSEGLVKFVHDFRNLTQVPTPQLNYIHLANLFNRLALLLKTELEANRILLQVEAPPPGIILVADENLVEQVLINLIKNAVQAMQDQQNKQINLLAYQNEKGRLVLEVTDNGPGINKQAQDKIFIPFYTTKKTGSGIGLSLSKQIMRLHNGTISVHSPENGGCTFRLQF